MKRNILVITLATLGLILIGLFVFYQVETSPIDKNSKADIEVVIPGGMSTINITKLLENKGLIRNSGFYAVYLKINRVKSLKASTYTFKKSMSMKEITDVLANGNHYNPETVTITFKEGENIPKYANSIATKTNNSYDNVIATINDKTYLNELIAKYWFLTEEILNPNIYYPLEGYLAPNTYQFKNKDVDVKEIVEVMLKQTAKELDKYKNKKLDSTIHQYLTVASMLELEGTNSKNKKMIAGVFENRLNNGMNLGSDVTTYYALQVPMTSDLTTKQFNTANPYNTRGPGMIGKLPVGPICNPSNESVDAALNQTKNDKLFFVADKKGNIFFTKTNEEHLQKVQEIKDRGDWIW